MQIGWAEVPGGKGMIWVASECWRMWGKHTCYVLPSIGGTPRSRKLCSHGCAHLSRPPRELCPSTGSILGVFLVQNALCLEGLQPRCTTWSCHFWAFPVCNASAGQARERLPSILSKKHSGASLGRLKVTLSLMRVLLWNILHGTTRLFSFFLHICVWSVPFLVLQVLPPQETGTAWPLFLLLFPWLCGFPSLKSKNPPNHSFRMRRQTHYKKGWYNFGCQAHYSLKLSQKNNSWTDFTNIFPFVFFQLWPAP